MLLHQVNLSVLAGVQKAVRGVVRAAPHALSAVFAGNCARIFLKLQHLVLLQAQGTPEVCQKGHVCLVYELKQLPDCSRTAAKTTARSALNTLQLRDR